MFSARMKLHPLNLTKSILDPVHGLVRLTVEELQVVNSPVFQRLRRIKQNGLLNYVFPAASHTRFEHSLGALFVVDSMLEALVCNGQVAAAKKSPEVGTNALDAVSLAAQLSEAQIEALFRVARLAALTHDLGHGPLSHTFESFAPRRTDVAAVLKDDKGNAAFRTLGEAIARAEGERIDHEWMSCVLFAELFSRVNPRDSLTPLAVAAAIRGEPSLLPDSGAHHQGFVPLLHDLIASAPADADRMDYVERDSRSCGVSYGLFDRSRLLKSFLCYLNQDGVLRLGIKSSGFRAVENFVQARFELFVQVYYHKTNRAVELMLAEIGRVARDQGLSVVQSDTVANLIAGYLSIGDEKFLDLLSGRGDSSVKQSEINALAIDVGERRLWRRVEDFREALVPSGSEDSFYSKLTAQFSEPLTIDRVGPKASKDLDQGAALLFRGEDGVYRASNRYSWTQASPLIRALAEQENQVVRIYYKGSQPEVAQKIRLSSLQLEHEYRAGAAS